VTRTDAHSTSRAFTITVQGNGSKESQRHLELIQHLECRLPARRLRTNSIGHSRKHSSLVHTRFTNSDHCFVLRERGRGPSCPSEEESEMREI
jgi:hypothetical protein